MIDYLVFSLSTGEILRAGDCSEVNLPFQMFNPGEAVLTGKADRRFQMVDVGTLTVIDRPRLEGVVDHALPGDGQEHTLLDHVPVGTEIRVSQASYGLSSDPNLTFVACKLGTYKIELYPPFPLAEASFTVTVE